MPLQVMKQNGPYQAEMESNHFSHGHFDLWQLSPTWSSVLFCSLAVLYPRVGHTMDVLSPFISIL